MEENSSSNDNKFQLILEKLCNIENRLKRLERHYKENENNFMREVGANVLGDYLYNILDENWIRRNKSILCLGGVISLLGKPRKFNLDSSTVKTIKAVAGK